MAAACRDGGHQAKRGSAPKDTVPASSATEPPNGPGPRGNVNAATTLEVRIAGKQGYVVVPPPGVEARASQWHAFAAWQPDETTLTQFEHGLDAARGIDTAKVAKLSNFIRQYRGTYGARGEKILTVDFYCQKPEGIERHPVILFDWFGCQASVEYFPDSHVYARLSAGGL